MAQSVYRLVYGLDDRGIGVRVPVWSRNLSTTSRPGPTLTSYPMDTAGYFPRGKAAGA
jgi:hypothetical protein